MPSLAQTHPLTLRQLSLQVYRKRRLFHGTRTLIDDVGNCPPRHSCQGDRNLDARARCGFSFSGSVIRPRFRAHFSSHRRDQTIGKHAIDWLPDQSAWSFVLFDTQSGRSNASIAVTQCEGRRRSADNKASVC